MVYLIFFFYIGIVYVGTKCIHDKTIHTFYVYINKSRLKICIVKNLFFFLEFLKRVALISIHRLSYHLGRFYYY